MNEPTETRTAILRIFEKMFDGIDENTGIYPTTEAYDALEKLVNDATTKPKGSMSIEELIFSQVRLLADVYKRSLPKQFLLDLDALITSFPY